MEDGSDVQHVRVFWDMAHGNELALHDLRELDLKVKGYTGQRRKNSFYFFYFKKHEIK